MRKSYQILRAVYKTCDQRGVRVRGTRGSGMDPDSVSLRERVGIRGIAMDTAISLPLTPTLARRERENGARPDTSPGIEEGRS
jgi:hypothetical protein